MSNNLAKFFASFFYAGFLPLAPGTFASFLGLCLYELFYRDMATYTLVFIVICILGFLTSGIAERAAGKKDPSFVVIDEVAGAMIAFFMLPLTPSVLITAFFIFRAFDMFKIYPANRFEAFKGGAGIMMDDVMAGVYTNLIMRAALQGKDIFF